MSTRKPWRTRVSPEDGAEPGDEDGGKNRQFITALARGLDVLRAFDADDPMLGNQDIAARTGLPKPTVSRITYTLTELGYLRWDAKLEKYRLGSAVLGFTQAYMASMVVRDIARPHMQDLAQDTGCTVGLGDRDRLSMVCVEVQRALSNVILHMDTGTRLPIGRSAMGCAWLAHAPEGQRRHVLDALAAAEGKDWPALRDHIQQAEKEIADTGFCLGVGTWMPDIVGAGCAFVSADGQTVHAFNIGGPAFVVSEARMRDDIGPRLVAMVRAVQADAQRRGYR
ncbi:IclR family transcriptional regulator [Caenispirillum bisanense]|uniref:IclR family transcriptional regulator n=1 Tax=Caenispirillum bisanense TaxID=414052 RepID=UPI0031E088C6